MSSRQTEAYKDHGANPPGSYAACQAALKVYELLGQPEHLGWAVREGGHGHRHEDFETLLEFLDLQFGTAQPLREFQRPLFPDLESLLTL